VGPADRPSRGVRLRVTAGDEVSFVGTVTGHGPGFAEKVAVDSDEGADMLTAQRPAHPVPRTRLTLDE
jgi:hypothetical protein